MKVKTTSVFTSRTLSVLAAILTSTAFGQETIAPQKGPSEELDTVTVTGSFIRRSPGVAPASPVSEVGAEEIAAHSPKSVADFLTELPFNVNGSTPGGRGIGTPNGAGGVNLRNLGQDATLILLNSRRVARDAVTVNNVDVNAVVPQIAIQKVEILRDGASSLYGSDAVGGVVNFFTRKNFDGVELQANVDVREYGRTADERVGVLWGTQGERGGMIFAFEALRRDPYDADTLGTVRDNLDNLQGQARVNAWPARFTLPNRDAAGNLITTGPVASRTATIADKDCALFTANNYPAGVVNYRGTAYPATCQQNIFFGINAASAESRNQGYFEVHRDLGESARFFGEASFLRGRAELGENPAGAVNPGPGQPAVIIPGYAPSSTFRAVNAAGQPLFAQSSGVQLGYDKNGDGINEFVPLRNAAGAVVVTGTNPANGVPFWEDVVIANGSRIFGLNCNLSGDPASRANCRKTINPTRFETDAQRFVGGVEGDLWGDRWHYLASYVYSANDEADTTIGASFSMPALRASLAGFGGPGCLTPSNDPLLSGTIRPGAGACDFLNVFGNSVTAAPGSLLANDRSTIEYVTAQDWFQYKARTQVMDLVFSGTLLDLPAGALGVAFGGQRRTDNWSADYPSLMNRGESDLQAKYTDRTASQAANAVFAELSAPLINGERFGRLELSAALRYENTSGPGLSTTDPKVGLLYSTRNGFASVRSTWSTSFLGASLYQRFRENAAFANAVDDVLTPAVDNLQRVPTYIRGNDQLNPQTSENYNIGFTVKPSNGFSVDVDWWHFKFEQQIALQNALQLAANPATTVDPSVVLRDPTAGVVLVNGVNVGPIVGFNLTYVNNASLETAGLDFAVNYVQDLGAWGSLRNSLLATYQTDYSINGRNIEASRNATVPGASFAIPWRATLRNSWSFGNNSVYSLLKFTDGFRNDAAPNAGTPATPFVDSYLSWDLSYAYAFDWSRIGLRSGEIALGLTNVMDKDGPYVADGNHMLPSLYDLSGRHIWARVKTQF